jgi:hypothetical protein
VSRLLSPCVSTDASVIVEVLISESPSFSSFAGSI